MIDVLQKLEDELNDFDSIFEDTFDKDELSISIENSVLSECLKNQVTIQLRWEQIYRHICWIMHCAEDETERLFSIAFKELMSDSYKKLQVSEAKTYALSDHEVVKSKKILNRAKLLKGNTEGVLDSIKTRGYVLKNVCDVVINDKENYVI